MSIIQQQVKDRLAALKAVAPKDIRPVSVIPRTATPTVIQKATAPAVTQNNNTMSNAVTQKVNDLKKGSSTNNVDFMNNLKATSPEVINSMPVRSFGVNNEAVNEPEIMPEIEQNIIPEQTPLMTREEYLASQNAVANSTANLQYDALQDDLKNRTSQILAKLGIQMEGVGDKYAPQYVQNEQNRYGADKNMQSLLARRGMLNSGVDIGNQLSNQLRYDGQRQGIDLAEQGERRELQGEINSTELGMNNELTSIAKQRANYLAQQSAMANQGYDEYARTGRNDMLDQFWKGKEFGLAQEGMDINRLGVEGNLDIAKQNVEINRASVFGNLDISQQKLDNDVAQFGKSIELEYKKFDASTEQFTKGLDLEYAKMDNQDKQFYDGLNQTYKIAGEQMAQNAHQFAQRLGFDYEQLSIQSEQFTQSLGLDYKKLSAQVTNDAKRLAVDLASNQLIPDGTGGYKLTMEAKQRTDELFEMQMKERNFGMDSALLEIQMKENIRIDNAISGVLEGIVTKDLTNEQGATTISGLINTTFLDPHYKEAKMKQMEDTFGITAQNEATREANRKAQAERNAKKQKELDAEYRAKQRAGSITDTFKGASSTINRGLNYTPPGNDFTRKLAGILNSTP